MISLITTLYRSEHYLKKYLERSNKFASFLLRNNVDFEIIIISNDSTIREKRELEKFKNLNKWVRVFYVSRESCYASWNRAVELAKNKIVVPWDVDNNNYPEAVIDGLKLIKEGAEIVYFPFIIKWYINFFSFSFVIRKRMIYPPKFNRKEFTRSMHCGPFFIFTKSFYRKVGPFDEQFKIAGDFDWCIRAAKINDFKLSEKIAGEFSVSRGALSSGKNPLREAENNVIYKRHSIFDKVKKVDRKLESLYDPKKIFCSDKSFELFDVNK